MSGHPDGWDMPWMPFWTRDWLTLERVRLLTWEQRGVLVDLMCRVWNEGSLPADPASLARVLGMEQTRFEELWEEVSQFFEEADGEPGRLVHPKVDAERKKRAGKKDAQSSGGKKAQRKRRASENEKPASGRNPESNLAGDSGAGLSSKNRDGRKYSDADADPEVGYSEGNGTTRTHERIPEVGRLDHELQRRNPGWPEDGDYREDDLPF